MPSKNQKQKNYALLGLLLALFAVIFAISFIRVPLPH